MKAIAENHITITRQLFTEGDIAVKSSKYRKSLAKLAAILLLVCLVSVILVLAVRVSPVYLIGEFIFIAALLIWLIFILPKTGCKTRYKAMFGVKNTPPFRNVLFYEDRLTVIADSGKETTIFYADIARIFQSAHLWILKSKNGAGVLLKKDGFIFGNMDIVQESIQKYSAKSPQ